VTLINTAPRGTHAQAQLMEALTTMSARIVQEAIVNIDLREVDASAKLEARHRVFIGSKASTTVISR